MLLVCAASAAFAETENLKPIVFCLDWTPNTNHTGLYAAQALGYYREAGLDVQIVQPPEDGATLMCAAGQAQFAIEAQDTMAASLDLETPMIQLDKDDDITSGGLVLGPKSSDGYACRWICQLYFFLTLNLLSPQIFSGGQ